MDSKRNFKLDSSQYRTCLSYLNAYLLLVEYTPHYPPVRGVYKPKKMTKFFKLVYPPYPLKQQQLII